MFKSNYKWYILVLAMLAYGMVTGADRMCIPVLFKEISLDLNLNMVSIGTIWGMDPLAGIFVGILGGLLADRFGIKRTLTGACLLGGIFCAIRGLSTSFLSMAGSMFLFGLVTGTIFTVAPKITAVWFSGKYLGLANALLMVSMSIFSMAATMSSATVLSPWLGGWRNVLFVMGVPAVLIGLLWWTTGREPGKNEIPETMLTTVPLRQAFSRVIRNKEVWGLGLVLFTFMGSMTGMGGYLAIYLRNIGWSTLGSSTALTMTSATGIVGMIPMVLLATRLKATRGMFIFSLIITGVTLAIIPFVDGLWMWALLIVGGLLRSAGPALGNTLIFKIRGIGGTYAGTALGLASTLGMLGAFAAPPLGNSLASISPGMPFIFWAILSVAALPLFQLLREKSPSRSELW